MKLMEQLRPAFLPVLTGTRQLDFPLKIIPLVLYGALVGHF